MRKAYLYSIALCSVSMLVGAAHIEVIAAASRSNESSELQIQKSLVSAVETGPESPPKLVRRSSSGDFHAQLERFVKGKDDKLLAKMPKNIKGVRRFIRFAERGLSNTKSPYRDVANDFVSWIDRTGCKRGSECRYPPNLRLFKFAVDAKDIPTAESKKIVEAFNAWWVSWRSQRKWAKKAPRFKIANSESPEAGTSKGSSKKPPQKSTRTKTKRVKKPKSDSRQSNKM